MFSSALPPLSSCVFLMVSMRVSISTIVLLRSVSELFASRMPACLSSVSFWLTAVADCCCCSISLSLASGGKSAHVRASIPPVLAPPAPAPTPPPGWGKFCRFCICCSCTRLFINELASGCWLSIECMIWPWVPGAA